MKLHLKLPALDPIPLDRPLMRVGTSPEFEIVLRNPVGASGLLFTVRAFGSEMHLIPAAHRLSVNGKRVSDAHVLHDCDRIECGDLVATAMELPLSNASRSTSSGSTVILERVALDLGRDVPLGTALRTALASIVEISNAETGFFVAQMESGSEWELLATVREPSSDLSSRERRTELVSQTILNEALETRKPVFVESISGHVWQNRQSILSAMVHSAACLPLLVGDRAFGAVYLYTRHPERVIRRERLDELQAIAAQVGLLLVSQSQIRRMAPRSTPAPAKIEGLLFDRTVSDHPMFAVEQRLVKLAVVDLPLLITGESGTGKELAAREIHRLSPRKSGPFVAVNCGAIPPTLMESTLFGYTKGAFTGAHRDQPGKFVLANGGTIFLDEIGDLSLELQVKLLRVLQEREVEAVGSEAPTPVDFRVVAATHQDLEKLVAEGKFRSDLYFRLNGATIRLPALRQRGSDVLFLAKHFLSLSSPESYFSNRAEQRLQTHSWPGNVRELQQVVARASALADGNGIEPDDFELSVQVAAAPSELDDSADTANLREAQLAFTREYIAKVLAKYGDNRQQAANHLGISERTLYRILSSERDEDSGVSHQ